MATSKIRNDRFICHHIGYDLPTPITINPGESKEVLSSTDLSSLYPSGYTLKGVVFLWATTSNLIAVDTFVNQGLATVKLKNFTTAPYTVSKVNVLGFLEC